MSVKNPIVSRLETWQRRFQSQPLVVQYRQFLLFMAVFFIACFQILLWQHERRKGKIELPNLPADASIDAVVKPFEKRLENDEQIKALSALAGQQRQGAGSNRDTSVLDRNHRVGGHTGLSGDTVPALTAEKIRAIKELYRHQHGRP